MISTNESAGSAAKTKRGMSPMSAIFPSADLSFLKMWKSHFHHWTWVERGLTPISHSLTFPITSSGVVMKSVLTNESSALVIIDQSEVEKVIHHRFFIWDRLAFLGRATPSDSWSSIYHFVSDLSKQSHSSLVRTELSLSWATPCVHVSVSSVVKIHLGYSNITNILMILFKQELLCSKKRRMRTF